MMRLWRKRSPSAPHPPEPEVLQGLLTLHQAYEGLLITGGTGSGKTTGPGAEAALNLLKHGAGFCVLCAKPDEFQRWAGYCEGLDRPVIRFAPGTEAKCDLLAYELAHGEATVEAAAQLLDMLVEVASRTGSGQGDEPFWALFAQKIFRRAIATVWLAKGTCSLSDVYKLIVSAPESVKQAISDDWQKTSFCAECVNELHTRHGDTGDAKLCRDFWAVEWPNLSEKTRSVGYAMTTNVLDKFLSGAVAEMVSSGVSTVTPEHVMDGAIVILDMPVLKWREPGQFFQIIFKTLVQRAVLRRVNPSRPVVVWADEAQFFTVPEVDGMVQTVARQAKLINVVLTQNLPMLISAMGGSEKARHEVDGYIANFQTKVLCANACKETNEYFSKLLGDERQYMLSGGTQQKYDLIADFMGQSQGHAHFQEQWQPAVRPEDFTRLRKGGAANGFTVEALITQGGRSFWTGKTWAKAAFRQRL